MKFLALALLTALSPPAVGEPLKVEELTFRDITFTIVKAKPSQVRVLWKNDDGKLLFNFSSTAAFLKARGEEPVMLCNGGIYEPGKIPSGLLVQGGRTLRPLNLRDGKGNFFLKPNGVFWVAAGKAGVIAAEKFDPAVPQLTDAVQSGPLLLASGKTHPAFNEGSKNRLHRNGVGVTRDGQVVFAISDFHGTKLPNLWEFADLFRSLGCDNALFLDGDISQMRTGDDVGGRSNLFASVIAVVADK
jgi:uncharacterized protein YigE (DUF2233 family)